MPTRTPEQIVAAVERMAGRGIEAAARHLALRIQEVVSVPAPLVPGSKPPRAATRATPEAPPRRVSGALRSRVQSLKVTDLHFRAGVFDIPYAARLEKINHKYLMPTIQAEMANMRRIIGEEFNFGIRI